MICKSFLSTVSGIESEKRSSAWRRYARNRLEK